MMESMSRIDGPRFESVASRMKKAREERVRRDERIEEDRRARAAASAERERRRQDGAERRREPPKREKVTFTKDPEELIQDLRNRLAAAESAIIRLKSDVLEAPAERASGTSIIPWHYDGPFAVRHTAATTITIEEGFIFVGQDEYAWPADLAADPAHATDNIIDLAPYDAIWPGVGELHNVWIGLRINCRASPDMAALPDMLDIVGLDAMPMIIITRRDHPGTVYPYQIDGQAIKWLARITLETRALAGGGSQKIIAAVRQEHYGNAYIPAFYYCAPASEGGGDDVQNETRVCGWEFPTSCPGTHQHIHHWDELDWGAWEGLKFAVAGEGDPGIDFPVETVKKFGRTCCVCTFEPPGSGPVEETIEFPPGVTYCNDTRNSAFDLEDVGAEMPKVPA